VAILSRSEFEAIVVNVINRIERALVERGQVPTLEAARDELKRALAASTEGAKLKAMRKKLDTTADAISEGLNDEAVTNQLWDILDYIDYRA
jgi:hypothetical protein